MTCMGALSHVHPRGHARGGTDLHRASRYTTCLERYLHAEIAVNETSSVS